jgi:RNA polymerase primary sigma factor
MREWLLILPHWEAGPAQRQAERELQACLGSMLAGMPDRLGHVIRRRYALDGESWQTLAEIGRELGVCKERIRQLQVEALIWLRHPAHSQELRSLLQRHSLQDYIWAEEVAQSWLRHRGGRHAQT